jgi:hypothetical protein
VIYCSGSCGSSCLKMGCDPTDRLCSLCSIS